MAGSKKTSRAPAAPKAPATTSRLAWGWRLALLLAIGFLVYANALSNGFVSDDNFQLLGNRYLTDWHSLPRLFSMNVWSFAEAERNNYYRPLMLLLYMAEYYAFGFDPFWFHLVNLLLHLAGLAALFFLARRLTGSEPVAFLAGLFFALHPIHTEAVVWVAVLTDVACGLLLFLGLWWYAVAREGSVHRRLAYTGSVVAFFLALLTKETALLFPAALVAYGWTCHRETLWDTMRSAARFLPYALVLGIYLALRWRALGQFAPAQGVHFRLSGYETFLSGAALWPAYLGKLLLPMNLNYFHTFHPTRAVNGLVVLGLLLFVLFVSGFFWLRRRQPVVAFSLAWFLLTLAPALNIAGVGENVFAERYLYIPSFSFCLLAALGFEHLRTRLSENARLIAYGLLGLLFVFYAVETVARNRDWKDDLTLFRKTAEQSPDSATVLADLGFIYYARGQYDDAIAAYRRALAIKPDSYLVHNNLGNALAAQGDIRLAIAELQESLRLNPDYLPAYLNLGLAYAKAGQHDEAIASYRRGLARRADWAEVYAALGLSYAAKKQMAEAIAAQEKAVALKPDYVTARINLAVAYSDSGRREDSIRQLQEALRIDPRFAGAHVAHYNLGVNYEQLQQFEVAQREYEAALALRPDFTPARQSLERLRARLPSQPRLVPPLLR